MFREHETFFFGSKSKIHCLFAKATCQRCTDRRTERTLVLLGTLLFLTAIGAGRTHVFLHDFLHLRIDFGALAAVCTKRGNPTLIASNVGGDDKFLWVGDGKEQVVMSVLFRKILQCSWRVCSSNTPFSVHSNSRDKFHADLSVLYITKL